MRGFLLLLFCFCLSMTIRVSQKNQKSEFCFATNPTGFHRLDEPPEKFQHYRPTSDIEQAILVLHCKGPPSSLQISLKIRDQGTKPNGRLRRSSCESGNGN